ncbi:MAG: pilus assembly protein [Alphaproteobacteria bacterium]|nr:pilus assembly protein [Alphaproteobacteria bacterium]
MHHHATANHKSYHHYGGILIEFALSVPVLITLLFFVCDHYRYYEIQSKVRTSAYLAASMIQQVANTRTTKALTLKDIINVSYARSSMCFLLHIIFG